MRHLHHIRPTDLMNPDVLSEVVLVGGFSCDCWLAARTAQGTATAD
jgi:hypothetical protein